MITTISESIKIATSEEKVTIRQEDEFEGTNADVRIYNKEEAIALAQALLKWADQNS